MCFGFILSPNKTAQSEKSNSCPKFLIRMYWWYQCNSHSKSHIMSSIEITTRFWMQWQCLYPENTFPMVPLSVANLQFMFCQPFLANGSFGHLPCKIYRVRPINKTQFVSWKWYTFFSYIFGSLNTNVNYLKNILGHDCNSNIKEHFYFPTSSLS